MDVILSGTMALRTRPDVVATILRKCCSGSICLNQVLRAFPRFAILAAVLMAAVSLKAQIASSAWPKFRANLLNTGVGASGGATNAIKWKYPLLPGFWVDSSPAIDANGTIYFAGIDGSVYSAMPSNGGINWTYESTTFFVSSPAIGSNGVIYLGGADGNVYAIYASSGTLAWTYSTNGSIYGSPTIGPDGTVYVGSEDYNMYALDGTTGLLKWQYPTNGIIDSSPALTTTKRLYVASGDGNVYAFGSSTDSLIWVQNINNSSAMSGDVMSSPAVAANGTVYVGSYDTNLYALNGATGAVEWTFPTGDIITGTPAIDANNVVYFGSGDGNVYAVNGTTGKQVWSFPTDGAVESSPALGTDGTIYVGSDDGNLYAIATATGSLQWLFSTGASVFSSPAISSDGSLYVGAEDGYFYAFGSSALASLTLSPTEVMGGTSATGTVALSSAAGPNGIVVNLSSNSAAGQVPLNVSIASGQTTATFTVTTTGVSTQTSDRITATVGPDAQSAFLTIDPPVLTALSVQPTSLLGGATASATVTINGPAPAAGLSVAISSSTTVASVPSTVVIAGGQESATFTVSTIAVQTQATAIIDATLAGVSLTVSVTINAPALTSLTVQPTTLQGGNNVTGTVKINGQAPAGGLSIGLSSNNASVLAPSTVVVAGGQQSATFTASTVPVLSTTTATLTASLGSSSETATLTLSPPSLLPLTLNPPTVAGGASSVGTVTFNAPAPSEGLAVQLASNNGVATVPAGVTVSSGQSTATFAIATTPVTSPVTVTITATFGTQTQTATLTDAPLAFVSITLNPSTVLGGSNSNGTANLNGPASSGGWVIKLTSSLTTVTVPKSVTIAAGQTSVSFTIKTKAVSTQKTATITGTFGKVKQSAVLTVTPAQLISVSINPATVTGGTSSTGTVRLGSSAPAGGISIKLAGSSKSATVPAAVVVAAGKTSANFIVRTAGVAKQTIVTITASQGTNVKTTTLTINAPVLISLKLSPATVKPGNTSTGAVTISGPAPSGGLVITLSNTLVGATMPATVKIAAGAKSAPFLIKTAKAAAAGAYTVSASLNGTTVMATLTIS